MRNISDLNINDGGRLPSRPPASSEVINDFESEFEVELPEHYKSLLRSANGGHPELDSIDGGNGQFAINRFYHLTHEDRSSESLWYATGHWRQILGVKAVPFANDGGGNQFFLDTRDTPASVKLCLHDADMKIVLIADSFEEFIDSLEIDPDMI